MPYAKINGQELFFEDNGGSGYPIIFMHGFLMDHTLFDPQIEVLAPRYRCIRFDARCFGQTKWDGKPFSLYDTASDCAGLMDFLNISSAVVVGMSQGGYAGLRFALKCPERVDALVLMSTWAGVDDEVTKKMFYETRDTWVKMGPIEPLINGLATVLIGPNNNATTQTHWDYWLPRWKNISSQAIFHAMNNLLERDDISSQVNRIKAPVLMTHGDADFGMPIELGEALSRQLPNCEDFVTVHGAAHAANFTHPIAINSKLFEFLQKQR